MSQSVSISSTGTVAEIIFQNGEHNFANPGLIGRIADAIGEIDADPAIRCSVLRSRGRAFCAGADLAGDGAIASGDGMAVIAELYEQAARIFARRKPMVAAIQGAAIGAGLGLALAADFRVAGPNARFSSNFVRLGFHPGFGLSYTLPKLIGHGEASMMMLTADRLKPDAALRIRLIDQLVDELDPSSGARALARKIADNAPLALVAVRGTLNIGETDRIVAAMRREHEEQAALKTTKDYAEGVAAVFERREPNFTGE